MLLGVTMLPDDVMLLDDTVLVPCDVMLVPCDTIRFPECVTMIYYKVGHIS